MNSEGNTNVADLNISDDMDTRAAASAKRSVGQKKPKKSRPV